MIESVRVGGLVFGNDFRHPAELAKETATLDLLSDGRLEVGLGAGWMTEDYAWTGIPHDRAGLRIHRMIEAAAGMLDDETPEKRIRAEAEEEIGYRLHDVRKVFEAFMSPGAVTEKLHFFVAEYDAAMRVSDGGGIADEGEDIEVLELSIDQAIAMISDGRIADAKTIMLLQYAALNILR
mgnify:CR=1 FL=1